MTTFEGPGADVSLIAFKVVRMFLSITTICYKTDRTNRCLSLPFLSKGVSWKSSSLASKAVFLNKFACVYANRERNPRSTANGHLIYVISTIHLTYLSLYFALPLETEGHRLSFASYWSKEKKKHKPQQRHPHVPWGNGSTPSVHTYAACVWLIRWKCCSNPILWRRLLLLLKVKTMSRKFLSLYLIGMTAVTSSIVGKFWIRLSPPSIKRILMEGLITMYGVLVSVW